MNLKQIISDRHCPHGHDHGIVNEWEDILADELGCKLYYDDWTKRSKRLLFKMPWIAEMFMQTDKPSFKFTMLPLGNAPGCNKQNIVPCIIDFFLRKEEELQAFYKLYRRNPLVLISSREAYDFLVSKNCPLHIKHWGLSFPDIYAVTPETYFKKQYDIVMLGRQNPVLMDFVEQYKKSHPELTYVYRVKTDKGFDYLDQDGRSLGDFKTREEYMNYLRMSRVGLYATPGIDNARANTNGFSQVTPRFLEYLSCGCHVLARYVQNSDTDFYEFNKYWPSIDNYEDFEQAMDKALSSAPDMKFYAEYLSKHYTSVRAKQLQDYLKTI